MGILDQLTQGTAPGASTTSVAQQSTLPSWYNDYVQGIASRGLQIASQGPQQYTGQRVAGFAPQQQQAFDLAGSAVGMYQPAVQGALSSLQTTAAAGQTPQTWTQNWQQYMSPYTQGVVNEIARLGNQNLTENIIPSVQGAFVGAGQFGSERGADAMARAVRDAQTNISGLQAQALQQGYGTSANIFNNDASRALTGGDQAIRAASATGALAQLGQGLNTNDISTLLQTGGLQQAQAQTGLNTAYQDWQTATNFDQNALNNLRTNLSGLQLPTGQVSATNAQGSDYGASPLSWITALLAQSQTGK